MREPHLASLLAQSGPWTYAYLDGHGDEPRATERSRRRAVIDRLETAGAPGADIEAIGEALDDGEGLPSPSTRYLLCRAGGVVFDERFAAPRLGPERIGHGPVPEIMPLLRHRATDVRYLVVETGREGAQVRVQRATRAARESAQEIQGRTDSLPKVQAGGWSHLRYQKHSEEIWAQNQGEVAAVVERLVREREPRFVVIAGDVRARQLLEEQLSPAVRDRLVDVDAHTRAAGADDRALDEAIAAALGQALHDDVSAALDRASAGDGASGARGTRRVVEALQQARVDTLLLDPRLSDAEELLTALDGPPWVADGSADGLGSRPMAQLPVAEALARAALLSGARVLLLEEQPMADDAPRPDRAPEPPLAALRWSDQDAAAS